MEMVTTLAAQLGFGGLLGFVIGYALKKILKLLLVFIGLFFAFLLYLSYMGFIQINYEKFTSAFENFFKDILTGGLTLPSFLTANIPFIGSFVVGFGLGFKFG